MARSFTPSGKHRSSLNNGGNTTTHQTTQRIGLPPTDFRNHRVDGTKSGHALTSKMDQSMGRVKQHFGGQTMNLKVLGSLAVSVFLFFSSMANAEIFKAETSAPGGATHAAMVALAREIKEEINADIEVGQFRGAIENAWDDQSEISLIFEVKHSLTKNVTPRPASPEEEHLEFLWVHIDQLGEHTLLPTPLVRNCFTF